jgi:6-phosphogluconolactonase
MTQEVHVYPDLEHLSRAALQLFSDQAEIAVRERGLFLTALSGGGTPLPLFRLLARDKTGRIDWKKTHIFWGDERCVPPVDAESNYGQARESLLKPAKVPEENIHRINGELKPEKASKEYARVLKEFSSTPLIWPRFDLVLLGLGEDGHTASLFPGSPVEATSPTLAVTAHYQDRPSHRVTLTPPVFNSARLILFMAVGENKALTLARVLNNGYQPKLYPAQRIDPQDGRLVWLLDAAAAQKLPNSLIMSKG